MPSRKSYQSESDIQIRFFALLELHLNKYPCLARFFKVPNEGKRTVSYAVRMKKEGLKSGVPDTQLPYPTKHYHGLWIEFKKPGEKPTRKQQEWLDWLNENGHLALCLDNAEVAEQVALKYVQGYRIVTA